MELTVRKNLFHYLVRSIMSQQLSTRVATVIHERFLDLYGGKAPTAEQVLATAPEILRSIGLSNAKVSYVHNVSRFAIDKGLTHSKLARMNDENIISYLTEIKGVGRWTAEMLLMFALAREDVFAVDDLGIQQAMIRMYSIRQKDKKKLKEKMIRISNDWTPFRTYACMYLWRWKDSNRSGQK